MFVHWGQLLATTGTTCGIVAACTVIYAPRARRREAARVAALEAAALLQTTQLHATVTEIVKESARELSDATTEKLAAVQSSVDKIGERVHAMELSNATQFGGNGGGIRQAINEQGTALANLAGRFDQHLTEVAAR